MNTVAFSNLDFHRFIESLVRTIELKDPYTAGHSRRVSEFIDLITLELRLSDFDRHYIHIAAHLHDIGKIGIPDGILLKTASLSFAEYEVMKEHPEIGASIFEGLEGFEDMAKIIRHHHERFDGKGYPYGLAGDDIPYGAAIIAVADAFDAMTTYRSYKKLIPPDMAFMEIIKNSGRQFHPKIVEAFSSVFHNKPERIMEILREDNCDFAITENNRIMNSFENEKFLPIKLE